MAKKSKKHSLSTGSIVAIVLGILVLAFMILTFIDHQIEQSRVQDSEEVELYCDNGMILGEDNLCHIYPYNAINCLDDLEKNRDEFNSAIAVVNKLPTETCSDILFKHKQSTSLFIRLEDSSEDCLNEIDNSRTLLDELGYDMTAYLEDLDNYTSEMGYKLLNQKRLLEEDCS